jgi:uncharacterized membrane protein YcaP (DUF421 family)
VTYGSASLTNVFSQLAGLPLRPGRDPRGFGEGIRRQGGEPSFCKVTALSNVVQNAIIGNDDSLTGEAVGAITLVAVNAGLNRLVTANATAARIFDGHATTVIIDGTVVAGTLRRLGLRTSELDTAVRVQNADDVSEIGHGSLEPGGQLVLTLKPAERSATNADVADLTDRLGRIEALLAVPR